MEHGGDGEQAALGRTDLAEVGEHEMTGAPHQDQPLGVVQTARSALIMLVSLTTLSDVPDIRSPG